MKKQNLILTLMSINTVFANSLPPTPDYVALVQKPTRIERQIIETNRLKRLKMFEQRNYC